ncbi:MAG: DNA helicase RecQ [Ruminococcus sp.]|nr:DNA helicase RecQ [Ruminococcus sp.]
MDKYSVLKEYFGYSTFRKGQEEIIDNILSGRDILAVMPTGAGKSLCYQIPALMLKGITIVVSPLISLMKDQVHALNDSGIRAVYLNSSMPYNEYLNALDLAIQGYFKIVYVAPERLENPRFLDFVYSNPISMITIDEAHCVSQWGHDFRPSYLKIVDFISKISYRPIVTAFTATATDKVKKDISNILQLKNPYTITTGFDRQNLYFEVQHPRDKFTALLDIVTKNKGKCGIVYCGTRKNVEEVCKRLQDKSFKALRYHAGLTNEERINNQNCFIYDKCDIMVATNAFGMGIDKSNVSYVVHYNMPKNIESYYQEAGRAGRDGEPAECILLYSASDVSLNRFLIDQTENNEIPLETLEKIKAQERELLKYMTFYCTITNCLRSYILKYFGEKGMTSCLNCSNCLSNYVDVDITIDSQKILSCVYRANQSVSIAVLSSILRGRKTELISESGYDRISTFGIMKDSTDMYIRNVTNHLVLHKYLYQTDERYSVLRLTKLAKEVLVGDTKVTMKTLKSQVKKSKVVKNTNVNTNDSLFDTLKSVRQNIANVQSIPAYIIFSDATLKDMCKKLPVTKNEFLRVSGVGEIKMEKYGETFMKEIRKFKSKN